MYSQLLLVSFWNQKNNNCGFSLNYPQIFIQFAWKSKTFFAKTVLPGYPRSFVFARFFENMKINNEDRLYFEIESLIVDYNHFD